ncbi:MAG: hypothetical protein H0T45_14105 [Pyrinomonadaceae bacterium]|nr:hypothetical protein [Pyrinomonadaceae bacterium]MDQ3133909.1 hypothetical protein [Acidobacteriota bacterium]
MSAELLMEERPLTFELEYADEAETSFDFGGSGQVEITAPEEPVETQSKKAQIIALYESGTTDIAQIVRRVGARPSYVAQVLQRAGHLTGYFDLYTTTAREQNIYSRFFRSVLSFKTTEAARESVQKIDRLYNYFERLGDRAGQHQAMVLALTGKNRARWSGKHEEAQVFNEWLAAH